MNWVMLLLGIKTHLIHIALFGNRKNFEEAMLMLGVRHADADVGC